MNQTKMFKPGEQSLSPGLALDLAASNVKIDFSPSQIAKIEKSRADVLEIVDKGDIVYGINTGFGPLCNTIISKDQTAKLQDNLLRSHSVGVGPTVDKMVSKLMLVLKLQSLSYGYSGISLAVIKRIQLFIEKDVIPIIPAQGSVGASGDLAPLAHLFQPLIGLGHVWFNDVEMPAAQALQQLELEPLTLGAKEGLALINGTQFIAAHATYGLSRMLNCLDTADIIGAMSLEGVLGSIAPFDKRLHHIRPYDGSRCVANRLYTLLQDSEMVQSHKNCGRVQDPYSIRCMPQVHGTSRNAWLHFKQMVQTEINSVTDNPIILSSTETISGGNFHGQPLALPCDYAALAAHELGNISDRRSYLLLEGGHDGLPVLLMKDIGLNSGFMIPQYTSAALVTENKSLCFPASADSIPTSLGQEDHVSMGSISSRKLNQIIDNLEYILAIELVSAAQAFDFRRPLKSGPVLEACHSLIRSHIDHAEEDRVFADDIAKAHHLVKSGELNKHAKQTANTYNINLNGDFDESFSLY